MEQFKVWDKERGLFINDCDIYLTPNGKIYAGDLGNPPLVDITDRCVIHWKTN